MVHAKLTDKRCSSRARSLIQTNTQTRRATVSHRIFRLCELSVAPSSPCCLPSSPLRRKRMRRILLIASTMTNTFISRTSGPMVPASLRHSGRTGRPQIPGIDGAGPRASIR